MNNLHFFPARPAKEMCREQRGTISVRLLNNTFNVFKAFPEPNRARRMRIPARFYGLLLAGMFGLVLTGCGGSGGGGDDRTPQNPLAASNIKAAASGNNITVSWTNPNLENITGFNIKWVNVDNNADNGTEELDSDEANVTAGASNTDTITGLNYDATYEITVAVLYRNGTSVISVDSVPVRETIGMDPATNPPDGSTPTLPAVSNIQTAVSGNNITVSWTNPNRDNIDGFNIAWFNVDDDADDGTEEFNPPEANVSAGAKDNTYLITGLTYSATYSITVAVRSADQEPVVSDPVQDTIGPDPEGDDDNDGVVNREDLDYDGDGLIEIHNLDQLALLRDDLNGDGTDDDRIDAIDAVGSMGCPVEGDGGCMGYELSRSLNFSDAASYAEGGGNQTIWTTGSGWTPIGSCSSGTDCTRYTGIFEGNNHNIVGLLIGRRSEVGVGFGGLFAALNGTIRNLRLLDASVTGDDNTGLLVGAADNARLENILVSGRVSSSDSTGALAGRAPNAMVSQVIVKDSTINGGSGIGGLIGSGDNVTISRSYITGSNLVSNGVSAGGLIGTGQRVIIVQSYVTGSRISSDGSGVGGLIGMGIASIIERSYVADTSVTSLDVSVGGLIGFGRSATISFSYVVGGSVSGSGEVGGLRGFGISSVNASYWNTTTTGRAGSGESKTAEELQMPTDFTGADNIYNLWGNFWCNPDTGEEIESPSQPPGDFVRVWNLGTDEEYPVLNCVVGGLEPQGRAPTP